ncbi:MAG: cell division protein ZapA [Clostridia bacterium]|nr:cell division protein ZapA [Clostridia bacterium]
MNKSYVLNIAGTTFSILSDESEEYIRALEEKVEAMVMSAQQHGASAHKAALFVCMELCDALEKTVAKTEAQTSQKRAKKNSDEIFFPDRTQTSLF